MFLTFQGAASIDFSVNLETGGDHEEGDSETEFGAQAINHVAIGGTIENGKIENSENATLVYGENVFLGYGAQKYW